MMRGLAVIAVVFIHNTPAGLPQVFCRPFLNFCVGLFLFLSGMLSNAGNWRPMKRVIKVAIPYVIWTLIYVVLHNHNDPLQIPKTFIRQLITGQAAAMMYYVFVYCELTLLIPLIDKLARSKYRWLGFLISPIEILFMRTIPRLLGVGVNAYVEMIMGVSCIGWFIYFYLGYLLGNGLIGIRASTPKLITALVISVFLQIAEGYIFYTAGVGNCGTQMKLSAVLTGCIFTVLVFRYTESENVPEVKALFVLGECSFGIYFSHMAIMSLLNMIPHYSERVFYPANAIIALLASLCFVLAGKKIMGRSGRYLAF